MRRLSFSLLASLAVGTALSVTLPASAYGGGWGWGGRYYGGYGGYGGYGWGGRYYSGYGRGYGWGGYYPAYGYAYPAYWGGYYPSYSYYPVTTYAPSYYVPAVTCAVAPVVSSTVVQAAPVTSTAITSQSMYSPPATENAARVRVVVPADARVWVDGHATTQTGPNRSFTSPPLDPNQTYTYKVKAQWMKDGDPVERTREITVRANETTTVDFGTGGEASR